MNGREVWQRLTFSGRGHGFPYVSAVELCPVSRRAELFLSPQVQQK
jgi:hypothetical protein